MKRCVKEVWIKFDSQEAYSESQEKLFAVLDEAPGDSAVVIYDADIKGYKNLASYSFDETKLSVLEEIFGKDNVKYQERRIKAERQQKTYRLPSIRQIIPCPHDMYAVVKDSAGGECKYKVLMYALCSDGETYPLFFDGWYGVCLACDAVVGVDRYEMADGEIYSPEGERAEMREVIDLADVKPCPIAAGFYDKFRARIAGIGTLGERNGILEEMEEYFRKCVGAEPQNRDKLSETYQLLKRKCLEAELYCNG